MAKVGKPKTGKTKPKEREFPDGKSITEYRKYKTWSYKRWAWEFLCRNARFRQACDRVAVASDLSKSKVAKEFGLVKFKHYADVWTKSNVFPTFRDGAIRIIPNIGSEKVDKSIRILPGQVFIRFKLKTGIDTIAAIGAQLDRARVRLEKLHAEYNHVGSDRAAKNNEIAADPTSLIQCLRILDLKDNGIDSLKEIVSFLYDVKPGTKQYENLDDLVRSFRRKHRIENAHEYSIKHYRYLALRVGSPDWQ